MSQRLSNKVCQYITENIRPKYSSNREFADVLGISEGTVRRILSLDYNISIDMFDKVCNCHGLKMSKILKEIEKLYF